MELLKKGTESSLSASLAALEGDIFWFCTHRQDLHACVNLYNHHSVRSNPQDCV